ncbi:hypothetical protein GJ744_007985 [Endocarpon pusillum]|uniref:Extracellular membrane protein CFEM domain-containing protein n=1 Tax=Endocarpon pusillum TaxID=364733 RepID=A0A8H7AM28_9EURO|nr:hypothetical protein GJ744_007985 [Endocarpon pusillum]
MYFTTITTITALIAALAGQHVQAAPSPVPDVQARALYEALGKPFFAPSPALAKRACNCKEYVSCSENCSAFSGTAGSAIAQGLCILSCAGASHCSDKETSHCPRD